MGGHIAYISLDLQTTCTRWLDCMITFGLLDCKGMNRLCSSLSHICLDMPHFSPDQKGLLEERQGARKGVGLARRISKI
jgi:hypothetical protein